MTDLADIHCWEDASAWALDSIQRLESTHTADLETVVGRLRAIFPEPPQHETWSDVYVATQRRALPPIEDDELLELLALKQSWYGPENILTFGPAGITVRISDKLARLRNLERLNVDPDEETVRDTLMDLCGYAVLGVMCQYSLMELPLEDHLVA